MEDYIHIDQIEFYLSGEMPQKEKLIFESELLTNSQLKREFELYEKSNETISYLKHKILKQRIQEHIKNSNTSKNNQVFSVRPVFKKWLVAASFLILVIASGIIYARQNYCDNCLADLSSYEVLNGSSRGDNLTQESILNQFTKIKMSIETNELDSAEIMIQNLQESEDKLTTELADWQMIQVLLLSNNSTEAKILVEEILSNPEHGYHSKARLLGIKLNSAWRALAGQ